MRRLPFALLLLAAAAAGQHIATLPAGIFDSLTSSNIQISLAGNALDEASVNRVLASLVVCCSAGDHSNSLIDLSGGTNAAPTGQGVLDAETLTSAGWTVTLPALPPVIVQFAYTVLTPAEHRTVDVSVGDPTATVDCGAGGTATQGETMYCAYATDGPHTVVLTAPNSISSLEFGLYSSGGLNAFPTTTELSIFPSLTTLVVENSASLTALPAGVLDNLTALTSLNLSANLGLTALPAGVFDHLTALTSLHLSHTGLTALPAGVLDNLTALTSLNLSANLGLTAPALPAGVFDHLTALTSLDLSYTGLTALPAGVFDHLTALTSLNLGSNVGLTALPAGVFDHLTALQMLYLVYDDGLTTLPDGVFGQLTELLLVTLPYQLSDTATNTLLADLAATVGSRQVCHVYGPEPTLGPPDGITALATLVAAGWTLN